MKPIELLTQRPFSEIVSIHADNPELSITVEFILPQDVFCPGGELIKHKGEKQIAIYTNDNYILFPNHPRCRTECDNIELAFYKMLVIEHVDKKLSTLCERLSSMNNKDFLSAYLHMNPVMAQHTIDISLHYEGIDFDFNPGYREFCFTDDDIEAGCLVGVSKELTDRIMSMYGIDMSQFPW